MILSFDCETYPIGADNIAPPLVCTAFAYRDEEGEMQSIGKATADDDDIFDLMDSFLDDPDILFVGQKVAFDFLVMAYMWPELLPKIFAAYRAERVIDIPTVEKLLNLSEFGSVAYKPMPSGKGQKLFYSLATLVEKYLGDDITSDKKDEDSWRLRYHELDGVKFEDYPEKAAEYVLKDATYNIEVLEAQMQRQENERGRLSCPTAAFNSFVDFALLLITDAGFPVDPEARAEIIEELEAELVPEKLDKLYESGVLRRAESPRPYKQKKQRLAAAEALGLRVEEVEVMTHFTDEQVKAMEAADVKLTAGVKSSVNKKVLQTLISEIYKKHDIEPVMTEPSDKSPSGQISAKAEVLEDIEHLDTSGVLTQYIARAKLQKLLTTELPRMLDPDTGEVAEKVYPAFDNMKETSRTSSYADKLYPSFNCQNVDPRARRCYVSEPGHVLCSNDFNSIELVSAGQTQFRLFGKSTLGDIINEGKDPHAYLGAQLAFHLHQDFGDTCKERRFKKADDVYNAFIECKTHSEREVRDFYKHWRTYAKPTGLGYPGGLGAQTFVTFSKGYGVTVTLEEAQQFKSIWLATFPEFEDYFAWIVRECVDPDNIRTGKDGEIREAFAYYSPKGTYRARCTFTTLANGLALQTPTAEGAKSAIIDLVETCYNISKGNMLFMSKVLAFIHDEFIVQLLLDEDTHDKAYEISRIMNEAMQPFMPDVIVRSEPALMLRWDKRAEAVFDSNNKLRVWTTEDL